MRLTAYSGRWRALMLNRQSNTAHVLVYTDTAIHSQAQFNTHITRAHKFINHRVRRAIQPGAGLCALSKYFLFHNLPFPVYTPAWLGRMSHRPQFYCRQHLVLFTVVHSHRHHHPHFRFYAILNALLRSQWNRKEISIFSTRNTSSLRAKLKQSKPM